MYVVCLSICGGDNQSYRNIFKFTLACIPRKLIICVSQFICQTLKSPLVLAVFEWFVSSCTIVGLKMNVIIHECTMSRNNVIIKRSTTGELLMSAFLYIISFSHKKFGIVFPRGGWRTFYISFFFFSFFFLNRSNLYLVLKNKRCSWRLVLSHGKMTCFKLL